MCLFANKEKTKKHPAPRRRVAYKVVNSDGRPLNYPLANGKPYRFGAVCKLEGVTVLASRRNGNQYNMGFHVYTTLARAKRLRWGSQKIIKVHVRHEDWIAESTGDHEAVYKRIRVGKVVVRGMNRE